MCSEVALVTTAGTFVALQAGSRRPTFTVCPPCTEEWHTLSVRVTLDPETRLYAYGHPQATQNNTELLPDCAARQAASSSEWCPDVATSFSLRVYSSGRVSLQGRVRHADDRYAAECALAEQAPGWVEVTSLGLGDYSAGGCNALSLRADADPSCTCWTHVRAYTNGTDDYVLDVPLPEELDEPDVTIMYTASGFTPVRRVVSDLKVARRTYPGGTPPEQWLGTARHVTPTF